MVLGTPVICSISQLTVGLFRILRKWQKLSNFTDYIWGKQLPQQVVLKLACASSVYGYRLSRGIQGAESPLLFICIYLYFFINFLDVFVTCVCWCLSRAGPPSQPNWWPTCCRLLGPTTSSPWTCMPRRSRSVALTPNTPCTTTWWWRSRAFSASDGKS